MRQLSNQHDIYSKHSWAFLTSYSHCDLFPIYGSGQGAGNPPGVWCAISSVFDVYGKQARGVSFYSPNKTINVKLDMIGFVDDTSGSTNNFLLPEPAPLTHYANLTNHDAQQWKDTLQLPQTRIWPFCIILPC